MSQQFRQFRDQLYTGLQQELLQRLQPGVTVYLNYGSLHVALDGAVRACVLCNGTALVLDYKCDCGPGAWEWVRASRPLGDPQTIDQILQLIVAAVAAYERVR